MDAVIILGLALVLCLMNNKESVIDVDTEIIEIETSLNPMLHHDEQAFMSIAHELGFN